MIVIQSVEVLEISSNGLDERSWIGIILKAGIEQTDGIEGFLGFLGLLLERGGATATEKGRQERNPEEPSG